MHVLSCRFQLEGLLTLFTTYHSIITKPGELQNSVERSASIQYAKASTETFALTLGNAGGVMNVRGTGARTWIRMGEGDDAVYVSSDASVESSARGDELAQVPEGALYLVFEQLYLDFGGGLAQRLAISDAGGTDNRGQVSVNDDEVCCWDSHIFYGV